MKRRLQEIKLGLLLALLGSCAWAAPQPYGVWRGHMGDREVMVSLWPQGCGPSTYYELGQIRGPRLTEQAAQPGLWREGLDPAAGPTWTITQATDATLEGTWADAQGQHAVPLRLRKLAAGPETPANCDSPAARDAEAAYNAPRTASLAPKTSAANYQGRPYQALAVPGLDIATVQIPARPKPVPRLNERLRGWVREKVEGYFACLQSGANNELNYGGQFDPGEGYSGTHDLVFWSDNVLALQESQSAFCGDLYRDFSRANYLVWDLDTDQPLDPATWFRRPQANEGDRPLTDELEALVLQHYASDNGGPDPECVETVRGWADYAMYPTAKGMVITPAMTHAVRGCEVDTLVPWRELRPFLSPAGARFVRKKVLKGSPL